VERIGSLKPGQPADKLRAGAKTYLKGLIALRTNKPIRQNFKKADGLGLFRKSGWDFIRQIAL